MAWTKSNNDAKLSEKKKKSMRETQSEQRLVQMVVEGLGAGRETEGESEGGRETEGERRGREGRRERGEAQQLEIKKNKLLPGTRGKVVMLPLASRGQIDTDRWGVRPGC